MLDQQRQENMKVLVVEDESLIAMQIESVLRAAGHDVVGPVGRLDRAVSCALDGRLDAAVLDVNLNGHLVTPLADILVERGVPFVFATGYGEAGAPEGFDVPIVRKPYNVHQIVAALVEATGKR